MDGPFRITEMGCLQFGELHPFVCNGVQFALPAIIMEPNVDSLILKTLHDLPAYGIKLREIGRRACAAACNQNDPDPLPRPVFCP